MIWMDVDVALASVPVNLMPLLDSTDFKSIEDAVAYNAGGLALFWNFTTTGGVTTVTAVTPTTSGDYDWTDFSTSGMYGIEIPASGGASINNDTEGFGHFTGVATGVLPWRGPIIGFRAAALNNSLIDAGTTGLLAPTTAARTLDVTAGGNAGIDWANIEAPTTAVNLSATNIDVDQVVASISGSVASIGTGGISAASFAAGAIDAAAIAANAIGASEIAAGAITNAKFAAGAIDAAALAADAVTEIATGVLAAATADPIDANIEQINTTPVIGNGAGTPWGP